MALHVLVSPRYLAVMPVARVALGLDGGDVIPLSWATTITDDLLGSGVFVSQPDGWKVGDRGTLAAFVLDVIGG